MANYLLGFFFQLPPNVDPIENEVKDTAEFPNDEQ